MENKANQLVENKTWWVYGKMTQCFNGYLGDLDAPDEETAIREAFELAVDAYEGFAGLHGIRGRDDIERELDEETGGDYTAEDVDEMYDQEVSDNVYYWVREAIPGERPEDYAEEGEYQW